MMIRTWVMAILAVTASFASVAAGGAPMGLPAATGSQGQWTVGAEYGYERGDLKAFGRVDEVLLDGTSSFWTQPFRIEDVTSNMVFGTLEFNLCDTWAIFGRLGTANGRDSLIALPADTGSLQRQDDLDAGFGLAWGAGTRATFGRAGAWSFGGLAQVTWFHPGDSSFSIADRLIPGESWIGDVTLRFWQAQVALAAVYQVDPWHLWAGPFLQFTRGDMDFAGRAVLDGAGASTIRWTSDLQESSQIGAQFGARWDVTKEWNLLVEGQITQDSWFVGAGAAFSPEKALEQ